MVSEQYRALRTNLEFAAVGGSLRTIVLTSAASGAGKSLSSANLALVMAQAGKKTLLVDADLRRPMIASLFGLRTPAGLSNAITRPDEWDSVTIHGPIAGLSLLPSGPIPPNPSEMLGSPVMHQLLETFAATFDVVILDTPPVLAFTDAAILSQAADGTVLIVRSGYKSRKLDLQAKQRLDQVGARIVGAVLNAVPMGGEDHSYYYYGYGPQRD